MSGAGDCTFCELRLVQKSRVFEESGALVGAKGSTILCLVTGGEASASVRAEKCGNLYIAAIRDRYRRLCIPVKVTGTKAVRCDQVYCHKMLYCAG